MLVIVTQSCPSPWDPMGCSPPASSIHGILQARILEGVAMLFSKESFQPRDWTQVSCIAGGFLTVWATREAQGICCAVLCLVTWLCLTPYDPMDCSHQAALFVGILQARILEGVAMPSSRGSSQPWDRIQVPTLRVNSLPSEPPGKPKNTGMGSLSLLQGNFLTQESNWGLLHCRKIFYQLSYQGSPIIGRYVSIAILNLVFQLILYLFFVRLSFVFPFVVWWFSFVLCFCSFLFLWMYCVIDLWLPCFWIKFLNSVV